MRSPLFILLTTGLFLMFALGFFVGKATAANSYYYSKASWYGPGLYGNHTANGTVLTPSTWGVAHKSLRFGTRVKICYRYRCVIAPVIDRGPFIHGRTFDLTAAVARSLRFSGVQTVRWRFHAS